MKGTCKVKHMLYKTDLKGNIHRGSTSWYIDYIFLLFNTGSEILSYYSFKRDSCVLSLLYPRLVGMSAHCLYICKTTELAIIMPNPHFLSPRTLATFLFNVLWHHIHLRRSLKPGWVVFCVEGDFLCLNAHVIFLFPRFRNSTGICFGINDDHFS